MIIKPNKFLPISFSLAGGSQGLNTILLGGKVRWRAALTAHRCTGLHLPLKLWVRNMSFVLASLVEIAQFPNFPPILEAHKLGGVWVHTLSLVYGPEPDRLGLAAATGVGN